MAHDEARHTKCRFQESVPKQIADLWDAFRSSKAVFAACQLGIFDYLHESGTPQSAEAISGELGLNRDATIRLLDTLVCLEFLIVETNASSSGRDPVYHNAAVSSQFLTKSGPDSMMGIIMTINTLTYPLFSNIDHAVRDGSHQWKRTFGLTAKAQWKAFYSSKEKCLAFMEGMHSSLIPDAYKLLTAFDLSSFKTICDLGGGSGALAYAACQCYPKTKITVFDLPPVIELAPHFKPRLEDCPNQVNVEFQAGDFLTVTSELPTADLYILSRILHDWDDTNVHFILSKVFDSLPSGGGLLIGELLLNDDRAGPLNALLMCLTMLVISEGKERSAVQYKTLLEKHGFVDVKAERLNGISCDAIMCWKP